ncbi:divergent polysaccharide deacetylase family protein [Helicobacter sp. 23-1045]
MLLLLWGIIFASFLSADNIVLLKNVEGEKISIAESSAISQNLNAESTPTPSLRDSQRESKQSTKKSNPCEAPKTRPLRGAKNRIQGCSSATADFLLEAEKRGTPPKSEKAAAFWGHNLIVGGSGSGVQPFLREKTSESNLKNGENLVDSANQIKIDCHDLTSSNLAMTENSALDSANQIKNAESSLNCHTERSEVSQNRDFSPTAQNDNFNLDYLDCHDSASQNLAMTESNIVSTIHTQSAESTQKSTKIAESAESKINLLEQNAKNFESYTTKYFKKRNYERPFSSEAQDYKDSILIERDLAKDSAKDSANDSADLTSDSATDSAKDSADLTKRKKPKIYKKILESPKPKIVIIIDDIANTKQLDALKSVGLKLTPSIFPLKDSNAKMRAALQNLDFFMVHLPLEALAYKDEMDTITLDDSKEKIQAKIEQIKRTMPNAKYLNNHTGSKFTANKDKMTLLLSLLDLHNIAFVDSRTTPNTALPAIAQEQNRLILQRDIFIDNALDSASLSAQISEGVKIAKAQGYAILIAHPHKETLNALKVAKNSILKEVEIVYLNELDSALKSAKITKYTTSLFK